MRLMQLFGGVAMLIGVLGTTGCSMDEEHYKCQGTTRDYAAKSERPETVYIKTQMFPWTYVWAKSDGYVYLENGSGYVNFYNADNMSDFNISFGNSGESSGRLSKLSNSLSLTFPSSYFTGSCIIIE